MNENDLDVIAESLGFARTMMPTSSYSELENEESEISNSPSNSSIESSTESDASDG